MKKKVLLFILVMLTAGSFYITYNSIMSARSVAEGSGYDAGHDQDKVMISPESKEANKETDKANDKVSDKVTNTPVQKKTDREKNNDKAKAKFVYDDEKLTLNEIPICSKKVTEDELIKAFGKPVSKKKSEAAFSHYIYEFEGGLSLSYSEHTGIYTFVMNNDGCSIKKGIKIGDTYDKVKSFYGNKITEHTEGGVKVLNHEFQTESKQKGEGVIGTINFIMKDNKVNSITFEKYF